MTPRIILASQWFLWICYYRGHIWKAADSKSEPITTGCAGFGTSAMPQENAWVAACFHLNLISMSSTELASNYKPRRHFCSFRQRGNTKLVWRSARYSRYCQRIRGTSKKKMMENTTFGMRRSTWLHQVFLPYPRFQVDKSRSPSSREPIFSLSSLRTHSVADWCQASQHWVLTISKITIDSWFRLPLSMEQYRSRSTNTIGAPSTFLSLPRLARHPAERSIHDTIRREVWWPHMANGVNTAVTDWLECTGNRANINRTQHLKLFLGSSEIEILAMDILGLFPKTKNGNYFVAFMIAQYFKRTRAVATSKTGAKHIASICFLHWVVIYGMSTYVLTDNAGISLVSTSKLYATSFY